MKYRGPREALWAPSHVAGWTPRAIVSLAARQYRLDAMLQLARIASDLTSQEREEEEALGRMLQPESMP
jgi:uncharacterized protein (DUF1800 family)